MKRCPQCGRDYNDPTLSFCLDDGEALLDGPASMDEPVTAILPDGASTSESPTRTLDQADAKATKLSGEEARKTAPRTGKLIAGIAGVVVVALLALGGYWFYGGDSSKQIGSIAVMPFVNESGDKELEYLADGMTESLISSLTEIPNLSVKARSTVFYYKGKEKSVKEIGEELGVEAVLLGRVAQRGEDLKLTLELVDTETLNSIWSNVYNRKQADLVSLQSEIARDVATKIKSKLSGVEETKVTKTGTADPEAYQAYLKGRYFWNQRTTNNLNKAIEQFKIATDRDPDYALAYTGLADCYVLMNFYAGIPNTETVPKAMEYAERAIAIDDSSGESHASLAQVYRQSWRWKDSEREFKRAIELNPNYATAYHWYSRLLREVGRFDESEAIIYKAKELDPLSSVIAVNISEILQIKNDYKASVEYSLKIIELDPDFPAAYRTLGLSYLKLGRKSEGVAALEKEAELRGRSGLSLGPLGYAYAVTGRRAEATAIVKELEEKFARNEASGRDVAAVYAGLGDKDKAFEWLEKTFQRKGDLGFTRWEIPWGSLHDDPRYKDLLKRMGLPE